MMHVIRMSAFLMMFCPLALAESPQETKDAQGKKVDVSDSKPVSFWMEKKLEYAQSILAGLASGDLDLVAEKAEQMRVLSKVEGWIRNKKPGYTAHFQVFQFANAQLLKNARTGNLDGASIAFQQLTISCVSCHKMLRDLD